MLISGEADIGIATEALNNVRQPRGPALLPLDAQRGRAAPTIRCSTASRSRWSASPSFPIITYNAGLHRPHARSTQAFEAAGLSLDPVLTAMDADVIKTYVELGLGVGIVASIAFDEDRDRGAAPVDAGHLFSINLTSSRCAAAASCAATSTTSSRRSRRR